MWIADCRIQYDTLEARRTIGALLLPELGLGSFPSYTAREGLSSKIRDKLRVKFEDSSLPHALVIYGLGGAGKTQLALWHVEDHGEKYSLILWIDAKSPETVLSSFERCAGALRLSVDRDLGRGPALRESPAVENVL